MIALPRFSSIAILLAILLIMTNSSWASAVDWTTLDGKNYENVSVVKVEPDAVTIIYKEGGALIFMENLPTYLQEKFHYDPAQARVARQQRIKQDAADAKALAAEMAIANKKKQAEAVANAKQQETAISTVNSSGPPPKKH